MGTEGTNMVYDIKLSSVVPARVTGENMVHELTSMDLAMKLHYLKGLYYFKHSVVEGLTIRDCKEPMFRWLEVYYTISGRIRKSEAGRPFIKCNDSGVRIVEAKCDMSLDEFLENKDFSVESRLVPNQVLGPDLAYSPLVFIQFTWFKCGGISVGLSWSHVLGDAFFASSFMNMWSDIMAGKPPQKKSLNLPKTYTSNGKLENSSIGMKAFSVKQVELVKESWIAANNCSMKPFSFHITCVQLNHIMSEISKKLQSDPTSPFVAICALIWHSLAKIRQDEPRMVTFCRNDAHDREYGTLGNNQRLNVVKADFPIVEADLSKLVALIAQQSVDDETKLIDHVIAKDSGLPHCLVYGANLTFVDLENVDLYGLKLKGERPVYANYTIDGVGDEGVVLVLPEPAENAGKGRAVTVILPEYQVKELKEELETKWGIAQNDYQTVDSN